MPFDKEQLQAMVETVPVILLQFRLQPDGGRSFPYVSPMIETIFGLPAETVMRDPEAWFDRTHPDDRSRLEASIAESAQSMRDWQWEGRAYDKDGQVRWLRGRGHPQVQPDGSLLWNSVLMDFSEAGASAVELPIRLYARALESVPVGIAIADAQQPDMPLIYVNPAFERITGYQRAESVGRNCRFLQGPETDQKELQTLRAGLRTGSETHTTLRNYRKDGSLFWNKLVMAPVHDDAGQLSHFIGVEQDITAQRQAEAGLKASEARLRTVLDNAVDGIIVIDGRGKVASFNRAAENIFGYCADEVVGQNIKMLMPEPYHSEHDGYLERYRKTNVAHIIGIGREVRGRHKNGSTFPLDLAVSEMDIGGERLFTGLVRDITQRKRDEAALILAKEEAERANRAKSEFLSSMSHELRTPMNAVLGFAQLMALDPNFDPTYRDGVQEILKAGNHLLELINEVLDLSRIEAGRMSLDIEPVSILDILDECCHLIEPMAAQRHISVDIAFSSLEPAVRADRMRTKQVLLNILSNAVKYNREGGRIEIGGELKADGYLTVNIRDTGSGIAPERLGEVFQAFHRLGLEKSSIQGTGIGLTISKRLIEMMDGQIGVESALGQGTLFWIRLPLAGESATSTRNAATDDGLPLKTVNDGRNYTVLCVEDNVANLNLIEQGLKTWPTLRLLRAENAMQGLDLAEQALPDLILLDINLPDMNGLDVLHYLKTQASTQDIPVIAVTANAMPQEIEAGRRLGFEDYLIKPLDIPRFLAAVDRALARRG